MADLGAPRQALGEAEQKKANDSLLRAAGNGDAGAVRGLMGAGAAAGATDDFGNTPLHRAAMRGHAEVVELLLREHSADATLQNADGYTPLHLAALIGHLGEARVLLERSADGNLKNADGDIPLHYAAGKGQPEIAKLLLRGGADANSRNNRGGTPLKVAGTWRWVSPGDRAEVRELLLAAGATE
jgi:ankyrin repeat protein